jgi:hypothetical protein
VVLAVGIIQRLESEIAEVQPFKLGGITARLRVDQFEFVAAAEHQGGADLRADAQPVNAPGGRTGAVGFHRDLEAAGVDGLLVQL